MSNAIAGTFTLSNSSDIESYATNQLVSGDPATSRISRLYVKRTNTPVVYSIVDRIDGSNAQYLWTAATAPVIIAASSPTYSVNATVNNYVNTVAQSVSAASGSVLQISNIVLSPGEGLYVEPATGSRLDAVAYGVEIT